MPTLEQVTYDQRREIVKLRAENKKLREALEEIALGDGFLRGKPDLPSMPEIARAALGVGK